MHFDGNSHAGPPSSCLRVIRSAPVLLSLHYPISALLKNVPSVEICFRLLRRGAEPGRRFGGGSSLGYPGSVISLDPGSNPPATAMAEIYNVPASGYSPRVMDIDSQGVVGTWLASGHLGSFDGRKCIRGASTPRTWTAASMMRTAAGKAVASGRRPATGRRSMWKVARAACPSTPVPRLRALSCSGTTNLMEDTMTRMPISSGG
jgi:hypothetical protein